MGTVSKRVTDELAVETPSHKTYPSRAQDSAIPIRKKGIARVHQSETNRHVAVTLFALFELLKKLEIPRHNNSFA